MITIGDGTNSKGEFNGPDERPFELAIAKRARGGIIEVQRGI